MQVLKEIENRTDLEFFFNPGSMAVVGVSASEGRPGYTVLENLVIHEFEGEVFPVHPSAKEILGMKAYPKVIDIPDEVETVVSMVSPADTIELVEQCGKKGVKGLIVFAGGFSESGEEGRKLEEEMVRRAKQYGLRIMGPNLMGPVNVKHKLLLNMTPACETMRDGTVALVAQTGQLCAVTMEWLFSSINLGLCKSIDLGNKADVDDADILGYLEQDPETEVIAIHIEGAKDGKAFMQMVRQVSRTKPVVVLKTGRSDVGARAAASHSGALAGDDAVFGAALRQAGGIRAENLDELADFAKALSKLSYPNGKRVGVVTFTGAGGVMAADACRVSKFDIPELAGSTLDRLKAVNPPWLCVGNPIDVGAMMPSLGFTESYRLAIELAMADSNVDSVIVVLPVWVKAMMDYGFLADMLRKADKPSVIWIIGIEQEIKRTSEVFENQGIPVFPSLERAARALEAVYNYGVYRKILGSGGEE